MDSTPCHLSAICQSIDPWCPESYINLQLTTEAWLDQYSQTPQSQCKFLTYSLVYTSSNQVHCFFWGGEPWSSSSSELCMSCISGWASRRAATFCSHVFGICCQHDSRLGTSGWYMWYGGRACPGTTHHPPLVVNKHSTIANSSLKSKCAFAQSSKI